jgi:PAS domain S-box-containing protein
MLLAIGALYISELQTHSTSNIIVGASLIVFCIIAVFNLNLRIGFQRALKESYEDYQRLLDSLPDGIIVHEDSKIVYANPAIMKMVGKSSAEDIIGRSTLDFIDINEYKEIAHDFEIMMGNEKKDFYERRILFADNKSIELEIAYIATTYKGKEVAMNVVKDISERKSMEREILEAESKYRSLVEGALAGVYVIQNEKIIYVNPYIEEMLGYSREEINNSDFINFIFDCSIGSAIIGAQPGNPLIKDLLDMYDATSFGKNTSGKIFEWVGNKLVVDGYATSNYYYTYYILKHYPAFRLNNRFQDLGDFVIFPKEYFEIGTLTARHYAVHLCSGEWRIKNDNSKSIKSQLKRIVTKWPALFDKVQIVVRKRRYDKLKKNIPFYSYYLAQKEGSELPDL